ncbi:hypothetical protein [Fluviicola taffensis]|uniref:hypothetical protein n=1 Tax=Fluviicola taffensis TaxID=191579 RepID=UPI0031384266
MESRLIYESSKLYLDKVKWFLPSDISESEWIHTGLGNDLNKEFVSELIDQHFAGENLFLSMGRKSSRPIEKSWFKSQLENFIGITDFVLWDENFQSVIEVNKIGVLRKGLNDGKL